MPIKWSAVKVSDAMDMVEEEMKDISEGLNACQLIVNEAKAITNLPEYMEQHLNRLRWEIQRAMAITDVIGTVRNTIPDGAIEAERGQGK